jgi:hypothetical protein
LFIFFYEKENEPKEIAPSRALHPAKCGMRGSLRFSKSSGSVELVAPIFERISSDSHIAFSTLSFDSRPRNDGENKKSLWHAILPSSGFLLSPAVGKEHGNKINQTIGGF